MSRGIRRGNFQNGVYRAEWEVFEAKRRGGPAHEVLSVIDARALVAKYVNDVVVERTERTKPHDTHARYFPPGATTPAVISLAKGSPRWVVLHEIAHALTWQHERGHGAAFRHDYLVVIERELGPWWARRLRAAFRRVGYES